MSDEKITCDDCGACCQSRLALGSLYDKNNPEVGWIKAHPDRVDIVNIEGVRPTGTCYLKAVPGPDGDGEVCAFWKGVLAVKSACGIQGDKPQACYGLGIGSPECIEIRKALGLPTHGAEGHHSGPVPLPPEPEELTEPPAGGDEPEVSNEQVSES